MTTLIITGVLIVLGAGIIAVSACMLSAKISQEEEREGIKEIRYSYFRGEDDVEFYHKHCKEKEER